MSPSQTTRSAAAAALLASLLLAAAPRAGMAATPSPAAMPRPLSAAERSAVALALDYARRGAGAVWDRLAEDAPLRALDRAAALAEIGVRAGPAAGATWRLQTPAPGAGDGVAVFTVEFASGIDETLRLELVERDGWRLRSLTCLVDPAPASPEGPAARAAPAPPLAAPRAAALALALALALAAARPRRAAPGRRRPALAGLALLCVGAIALTCSRPPAGTAARQPAAFARLGELEPLRRALAAGDDAQAIERALARPLSEPSLARVRDLWRAQLALADGDLAAADTVLGTEPPDQPLPLEALLRARLALQKLDPDTVATAYASAIQLGPDHDGLRLEALFAQALVEEEGLALEVDARLLVEMGSRAAEPWYFAAVEAARVERDEDSAALLRTGWSLRPVRREELFGDPALVAVVARPAVFSLLALDSPVEPAGSARPGAHALAATGDLAASLCGSELRLERGGFELLVPGGADLAPTGVRAESAAARDLRGAARALAARPSILAAARSGRRLGPRLLRLAGDAAAALAEKHSWTELIALTDPLVAPEKMPPLPLARLRALALERVGRDAEALDILLGLAARELGARRPAPGVLFDLAAAFARRGDYERAIRLVRAADRRLPAPRGEPRLRQYEMSRDLEASARSYRSAHFDIRYPKDTGERYARQLATVFEAERTRLLRWIPHPGQRRVTVELFPVRQFLSSYGGEVIGVTQLGGPVRLPFADLKSLDPELVVILSHELAHALLDGATAGRAPHWFHEGLAQHVQMGVGPVNPLPDLAARGRAISVPALEPVIAGFAEPELVEIAYAESAWVVGFLEARWGVGALERLESAFAADRTSEEALADVTGLKLADFDAAFRRWALEDRPRARAVDVRRYDLELDSPLEVETGERDLPRLTSRPPPAREQPLAAGPAEMKSWYRTYAGRSAAVRQALAPVLNALQAGGTPPDPRACARLADETERFLAEPEVLVAPDPEVARGLRALYVGFAQLGSSCADGRLDESRRQLAAGQLQLEAVARLLGRYGLRP